MPSGNGARSKSLHGHGIILSPSVLAADFGRLEEQVDEALDAGCDWLHIDVMDGHFVPNISIGTPVIKALSRLVEDTDVLLDVHLMVQDPDNLIELFAGAGADILTVHIEACKDVRRTLTRIERTGAQTGVAVNPATPLAMLEELMDVDLLLVMSVSPGFAGQSYLPGSTSRIERLSEMRDLSRSSAVIEVDGGINVQNVAEAARAGADVVVAGSAIFGGDGNIRSRVKGLRQALIPRA